MIRPFTCVCFLLACGSGLYLYQSKHRVQLLDRQIEQTVHATDALREQTRVLHAEWTLLNDPQRLQALADQFLTLKTVSPGQFTSMADLDSRLPRGARRRRRRRSRSRTGEPGCAGAGRRRRRTEPKPQRAGHAGVAAVAVAVAAPAKPVSRRRCSADRRAPAERKPAPPRPPTFAASHAAASADRRSRRGRIARGLALPQADAPPAPAAPPYGGSALGMAHGTCLDGRCRSRCRSTHRQWSERQVAVASR